MGCIAERPAVDRLEAEVGEYAVVLRVSTNTRPGRQLFKRLEGRGTPMFVIYDREGNEYWRGNHAPTADSVLQIW